MTGKTYAVLGGGGSFGIHTALYLLHNANPKKVIGIGRSPLKPEPFSLSMIGNPTLSTTRCTSLMNLIFCWTF